MRSTSIILILFWLASASLLMMPSSVAAFGGSNVFGLFRKRRLRLLDKQMEREDEASRKGFAGPHGEPFSGDEAVENAQKQQRRFLEPLLGWFRDTNRDETK